MNGPERALWLAGQGLTAALYLWQLTIPLAVAVLFTLGSPSPLYGSARGLGRRHLWMLAPLLGPATVALISATLGLPVERAHGSATLDALLVSVLAATAVAAVLVVRAMSGHRLLAACVAAVELWYTWLCVAVLRSLT